jgi:hypothetical protein
MLLGVLEVIDGGLTKFRQCIVTDGTVGMIRLRSCARARYLGVEG